jgi:hypothetical protein
VILFFVTVSIAGKTAVIAGTLNVSQQLGDLKGEKRLVIVPTLRVGMIQVQMDERNLTDDKTNGFSNAIKHV